ncbi:hypothetical protein VIGAN_UM038200 [Vigna angularis var. angularis]|uniref:Uncharacterized protein n=1 Tax=Vigna angularis var. angularis TaxID=157739 RepID=A0A0S3TDY6_PHAAN|nr:hypothetical protein VIGAN_UM038200 [Vigna angularis var. angularis]
MCSGGPLLSSNLLSDVLKWCRIHVTILLMLQHPLLFSVVLNRVCLHFMCHAVQPSCCNVLMELLDRVDGAASSHHRFFSSSMDLFHLVSFHSCKVVFKCRIHVQPMCFLDVVIFLSSSKNSYWLWTWNVNWPALELDYPELKLLVGP